ncbi:MAG: DUF1559 domain-containing protein [Planctomycetota bacterium]
MRRAFTLIELLVVVSIIALLIAILLPVLGAARESTRAMMCKSNLRQIGVGVLSFSADNKQTLPGVSLGGWKSVETPGDAGWLSRGGTTKEIWENAPTEGVIYEYMESKDLYLCPSVTPSETANFSSTSPNGLGNGHFDYSFFVNFSGAMVHKIRQTSEVRGESTPSPLVVEEDPDFYINRGVPDSAHGNNDRMSVVHNGAGHYVAVDGSVHPVEGRPRVKTDWRLQYSNGEFAPPPGVWFYGYWNTAKP